MIFRARQFKFAFPRPALVMGILNVTPDSFSDAGENFELARAVARGEELAAEGADLLDVGGESTRLFMAGNGLAAYVANQRRLQSNFSRDC